MTGSLTVTWDDVITTIVGGTMVAGVEMRVTCLSHLFLLSRESAIIS